MLMLETVEEYYQKFKKEEAKNWEMEVKKKFSYLNFRSAHLSKIKYSNLIFTILVSLASKQKY